MTGKCPTCGAPAGPSAPDGDLRYRPEGSPALCARPREKVEAALSVARLALARIAGGPTTVAMKLEARRALSDILTLTEPAS